MENVPKKRVPVTEEEKQRSYYKYFEQDMAPAPQESYAAILVGPLTPDKVLPFQERNRLFEAGYSSQSFRQTFDRYAKRG